MANPVETLHRIMRKYTKNKMSFPADVALKKSVNLAIFVLTQKRTIPIRDWPIIRNQFIAVFDQRIKI